jgi:hypothetical protein
MHFYLARPHLTWLITFSHCVKWYSFYPESKLLLFTIPLWSHYTYVRTFNWCGYPPTPTPRRRHWSTRHVPLNRVLKHNLTLSAIISAEQVKIRWMSKSLIESSSTARIFTSKITSLIPRPSRRPPFYWYETTKLPPVLETRLLTCSW